MKPQTTEEQKDKTAAAIAWNMAAVEDGWGTSYTAHYCRRIVHVRGHGISLRWEDGRIHVRGIYPELTENGNAQEMYPGKHGERAPGITVAADKAPGLIANEIRKRFLSNYLAVYGRLKAIQSEQAIHETDTELTLRKVRAAVGLPAGIPEPNYRKGTVRPATTFDTYVSEITADGGTVSFEVNHCPVDVLLAILPMLNRPTA